MLVSDALSVISYALQGTDDIPPTVGDGDVGDYWLSLLNRKKDELYYDVGKQWSYIYRNEAPIEVGTVATAATTALTGTATKFTDYRVGDKITVNGETVRTIATITSDTALTVTVAFSNTASGKTFTRDTIIASGVQTYSLHRQLLGVSDKVYVLDTDGDKHFLDKIHPQENNYTTQSIHFSGGNPEVLTFTVDIESDDPMVGGTLVVPGYYLPADLTAETDTLPVPDPNWHCMAVASEIAFTDVVYEDRAEALNARANSLWNAMIARNRRGSFNQPRRVTYNLKRITDTKTR